MRLKSIEYRQMEGEPSEWTLHGLTLGPINLLVGKNASGKSRTLNIIKGLANLLSGQVKLHLRSGNYDTTFEHGGQSLNYVLQYRDSKVLREEFVVDGRKLINRGEGGAGEIFAEKEGKNVEFQTPENELAAVARRDRIQHPFFEPLSEWANSLYHYKFGKTMGQDLFVVITESQESAFNPRDTNQVVAIFRKGEKGFDESFRASIKTDMATIGYPLDEIGTQQPVSIKLAGPFPSEPVGLFVKETGLSDITDQHDMSQGMFRALSLIVQTTYSRMAGQPSCVLIDDIGEGLDFERSCALIELLMEKTKESPIQLIMATNDRFVMNKVPLEAWSLLQREGGQCHVRNYSNSKGAFDEFKFTGMNNFDFFAYDFVNEGHAVNE